MDHQTGVEEPSKYQTSESTKQKLYEQNYMEQDLSRQKDKFSELLNNTQKPVVFGSEETSRILMELSRLNQTLQFVGLPTLSHLQGCSLAHLEQIYQFVVKLLESRGSDKERIKELQTNCYKYEHDKNDRVREIDLLTNKKSALQRELEVLQDKCKFKEKEFRDKQEEDKKEIEALKKEKKAMQAREVTINNNFKKKDDKIWLLENKMRKLLQSKEKIEYRNSFEMHQTLQKKNNEQIQVLASKNINKQEHQIEKQNHWLKTQLRELIVKIFKLAYCNPQEHQSKKLLVTTLNLLQMPLGFPHSFLQNITNAFSKIEQRLQRPIVFKEAVSNQNPSDMFTSIQKLKFYYKQAEELDEHRSKMAKDIFHLLSQKQRLTGYNFKSINKHLSYFEDVQYYERRLEQYDGFFSEQNRKFNQTSCFLKGQIDQIYQKSRVIQQVQKDIEKVLNYSCDDNESLLGGQF